MPTRPIRLIPLESRVPAQSVLDVAPEGELIACDFHVLGIERAEALPWGYRKGRILNIDHHAPTSRMERRVSSANLAIACAEEGMTELRLGRGDPHVVLNHNDCDSILSGGIMAGRLPPDPAFGDAAIAADHTGEENRIADLLQGIDAQQARTREHVRDLEMSYRNLERLSKGEPLEVFAARALDRRLRERADAEAEVSRGAFQTIDGVVSLAVFDEPIGGEFFPAFLPDAPLILLATRLSRSPDRWKVKVRLGLAAPPDLVLSRMGIRESFDPVYGGRWNAGSNSRGGGTSHPPERYAELLAERARATSAL